ncbi:MAG: hypothetical protein Q8J62_05600 [Candidatus Cloacimonadaceae bacterium]|nr:hypothetical protein [Candidatus Cloacimonadaceae bacterium]
MRTFFLTGIAIFTLIVISACSANKTDSRLMPETGSPNPCFQSIYYYTVASLFHHRADFATADQLYRKAQDKDQNSYQIQKQILLNSVYMFGNKQITQEALQSLLERGKKEILFDNELLNAAYSFYNNVADTANLTWAINELESRYPSARSMMMRYLFDAMHSGRVDTGRLFIALDRAQKSPEDLMLMAQLFGPTIPNISIPALVRLGEIAPSEESGKMLAELILSLDDDSKARAHFNAYLYPQDKASMLFFLNQAFELKRFRLITSLAPLIISTLDYECCYVLAYTAFTEHIPDLSEQIDQAFRKSGIGNFPDTFLFSLLVTDGLISGRDIRHLLPRLQSAKDFENILTYYSIKGKILLEEGLLSGKENIYAEFVDIAIESLPESPARAFLVLMAQSIAENKELPALLEAKRNLVLQLFAQEYYDRDDIEFLGDYYFRNKLDDKRIALLYKAVELYPEDADFLNDLGYTLLVNTDHIAEAGDLINRAIAIEADNPFYQDSMAWYLYLIGDYSAARNHINIAIKHETLPSEIYYHAAMIHLKLGDTENARLHFQNAIDQNNDEQYVNLSKAELKKLRAVK